MAGTFETLRPWRGAWTVLRTLGALGLTMGLASCSLWGQGSLPAREAIGRDVDDLDGASLALAAQRSAEALEKRAQKAERAERVGGSNPTAVDPMEWGGRHYTVAELAASARYVALVARQEDDPRQRSDRLARDCRAFPAGETAQVTGYFEPVLAASRTADARFRFALYRLPSVEQLATLREKLGRTPTRADIDGGSVLDGLGLELAWVDDPVARFFLHVQGSGRLDFQDGTTTRVGFAGTNDLDYRSVGRIMLDQGLLEPGQASATAMRHWLGAHPDRRDELLERNPRYVFFRDTGEAGPFGALGTTLVAGRSVASDARHVPRGALLWLRSTRPVVDEEARLVSKRPLTRFVFAQDAGAAIDGPARLDLFVGSGEEAGIEAGGMNESGELYVLLCRSPRWWSRPAARRGTPMRLHGP